MLPIKALVAALFLTSVACAQEASNPVPLDKKGEVGITIKGAPVQSVIESIAINGNYDFVTSGQFAETVNLSLTGTSIQEALDTLTLITELEYRVEGKIITLYGKNANSDYTRIYKLGAASAVQIAPQIGSLVGDTSSGGEAPAASPLAALASPEAPQPGATSGTGPVIADRINNQLIVTAKPSIHRKIAKVLMTLDVPQKGELTRFRVFELKYISASLFKKAIKFQLPGFADVQFLELSGAASSGGGGGSESGGDSGGGGGSGSAGGSGASESSVGTSNTRRVLITETAFNLDFIASLLEELDRPLKQIYAEITLMKVSSNVRDQFGAGLRGIVNQAGRSTPLGEFFSNLGSGAGNLQLRFGTIGPEQFSVLFDYLKTNQRGEVVASPRMLVQEGQTAEINITQQFPTIISSTDPNGISQQTVNFTDVGTKVKFTPSVFKDGTIRLSINPEISNVIRVITVGDQGEVPVKDSNIIKTVLNVKDGHTAIIGGLKSQNLSKAFDSQPFLGKIPILGRLFHRHVDSNELNDLIFTLTPRVVEADDYMLNSGRPDESKESLRHRFIDSGRIGQIIFEDKVVENFYDRERARRRGANPSRM